MTNKILSKAEQIFINTLILEKNTKLAIDYLYCVRKLSIEGIAKLMKCSPDDVRSYINI